MEADEAALDIVGSFVDVGLRDIGAARYSLGILQPGLGQGGLSEKDQSRNRGMFVYNLSTESNFKGEIL